MKRRSEYYSRRLTEEWRRYCDTRLYWRIRPSQTLDWPFASIAATKHAGNWIYFCTHRGIERHINTVKRDKQEMYP